MEFPTTYNTFTIPTGAGVNQSRLVIGSDGSLTSYGLTTDTFIQILNGIIFLGQLDPVTHEIMAGARSVQGDNQKLILGSGQQDITVTESFATLEPALNGFTNGILRLFSALPTEVVDIMLTGNAVKVREADPSVLETWLGVPFAANWVATTSINGLGGGEGLSYRRNIEGDVWISGLCVANAGAGTTVGTLPVGYQPAATQYGVGVMENGAGDTVSCLMAISTTGMLIVDTLATPRAFAFNFRFKLGTVA